MQFRLFDSNRTTYTSHNSGAGTLLIRDAGGNLAPATDREILTAARTIAQQLIPAKHPLNVPRLVKEFFALKLNHTLEHEVFAMAMLNAQYELIEYAEPFRGTLTQASVYPREVVKMALHANAAAVIIGHNHPSGALQPSEADKALTAHLRQSLQLVDVSLLDHILVANNQTLSFAERGLL
ncbi:DNA repair protein RadC [Pusillimonas sp. T7-7]|uniref:JAB domain-containing protein n=1 Tax=Pusillimonas sp. (strain T7-7) TaxID=1007105 RepID=UPI000208499D|nr:JAB domain-containing protein [Pusillimonas sp. T7-7]AEC18770.1 DNA repair protein RadC [Pusillimonas sp. T7-7]